jgi:hypothetical protein
MAEEGPILLQHLTVEHSTVQENSSFSLGKPLEKNVLKLILSMISNTKKDDIVPSIVYQGRYLLYDFYEGAGPVCGGDKPFSKPERRAANEIKIVCI